MASSTKNSENTTKKSEEYSRLIAEVIPGGNDSPFRGFEEVGGHTIFFNRAQGSKLYDIDDNVYLDYLGAWGPAILGHCVPEVVGACKSAIELGAVFGAPHELELQMAKLVIEAIPSIEKVRFVSSGTEAVMSAVRLARGFKKKDKIVMFEGGYHGHSDATLCSQGHSSSGGVPSSTSEQTVLATFNDLESVRQVFAKYNGELAALVVEPVCGSMGVIPPNPGFLEGLGQLCSKHGVVFICDEVLTGLRVARGGAQSLYGIKPDITCLGKALGGGMPIGAYGGSAEIMAHLQPGGDVYQAGTFSGNPVTMAGGIATLKLLADPTVYKTLESRTAQLFEGLQACIDKKSLPIQLQRVGSMFGIIFSDKPVRNWQDHLNIDTKAFAQFFHKILARGVYMPPSSVDAACVSAAHSEADIEETIRIMSAQL
ncbi:MAG: glutamate-1-semialdehyde 2,1-aminomutase [Cyanobacteria bacterium SZAS-4]|nr:glutamate-1-semialdehyde 2,1-aminomutase [Cyanobacteria bacterium SZAS-4]